MLYKVLFWWWLAAIVVLFVENVISWLYSYVFLDRSASAWTLTIVSAFIGIVVWYSFSKIIKKEEVEDDYNF